MMTFFVNYQQFKYTDQSDNPPLRTWKIKAPTCEAAFTQAQVRAVIARQSGRKVGGVRRAMFDDIGNLVSASGDYIQPYIDACMTFV